MTHVNLLILQMIRNIQHDIFIVFQDEFIQNSLQKKEDKTAINNR